MNKVKNIKRFVDTYSFSYVDDAEFESKHKRDRNGQFAKIAESSKSKEQNNERWEEPEWMINVACNQHVLNALPDIEDKDIINAINVYTQDTSDNAPFKVINRSLRKNGTYPEKYKKECLALERGFRFSKTSKPVLLARGTTVEHIEKSISDGNYCETCFVSSSNTRRSPLSFAIRNAKKHNATPAILWLFVPKGHSAIKIDRLGRYPEEREILLPPKTKGIVRDKIVENGITYYKIEVTNEHS